MIETPTVETLRRRSGRKWRQAEDDVLAAWIADMDFAPAPPIARTLAEAVALGDFGYGPAGPASGVPQAFAAWADRRWQWTIDPADLLVMPDVVGGIANTIEALTRPGEAVLVQTPAYPPLLSSVKVAGRRLVEHPLVDGVIDFEDLEDRIRTEAVRMLLLCHPHNPTGRSFDERELGRLAALAERHDLLILSDEVHADLTFPGRRHRPFALFSPARTITLNAPSKAFNVAGLRTAICHATGDRRSALQSLPPTRWNAFSTLGLRAARAAWSEEGEAWLNDCVALLASNRARIGRRLARDLPQIGFAPPEAGYLAWLDCRPLGLEDPAAFLLERARLMLSNGSDFGAAGRGFVRLNFATSAELVEEMLDRLVSCLKALPATA